MAPVYMWPIRFVVGVLILIGTIIAAILQIGSLIIKSKDDPLERWLALTERWIDYNPFK